MKFKEFERVWSFRTIILLLAYYNLKLKYRSSTLGVLWNFLEPLLILSILFLVFSNLLKTDIPNYPIFLLIGIICFQIFSRTTSMGLDSILQRTGVLKSIRAPFIIFPISSSITSFYMMCFELVILGIFFVAFQFVPTFTIIVVPILLIMLLLLGLSFTIPLSVLNIHYRDTRSIWTIILQALFFLTPVIYKLDFLPLQLQQILQYSPLVQLVTMIKEAILENKLPDPYWFAYTIAVIVIIFVLGIIIFRHLKVNLVEKF